MRPRTATTLGTILEPGALAIAEPCWRHKMTVGTFFAKMKLFTERGVVLHLNGATSKHRSHLQSKVVLPRVGVRQARPPLPRRDGQTIGDIPRRIRREVLLKVRDHLVDGYAVRVEKRVVVTPAPWRGMVTMAGRRGSRRRCRENER